MELPEFISDWEKIWSPYDEDLYKVVLDTVEPEDVVLAIAAGDLRLARRVAEKCKCVYAFELNTEIIAAGLKKHGQPVPENLLVINVDARDYPFPDGITAGVLMMRHCQSVELYVEKLVDAGAGRLITNARWRFGVEIIDLTSPRIDYSALNIGSYACKCGSVGFKPGRIELLTPGIENTINEVSNCPVCQSV